MMGRMESGVGIRLGDYELIGKIGEGGMGEVWRAENVHTKVPYAVKLLPQAATGDPGFVKRFFDEGRLMAQLDHPHIVRVHHVGHDEASGRYAHWPFDPSQRRRRRRISRVLRGGSWNNNNPRNLLSSNRNNDHPENRNDNNGFRVVLSGMSSPKAVGDAR